MADAIGLSLAQPDQVAGQYGLPTSSCRDVVNSSIAATSIGFRLLWYPNIPDRGRVRVVTFSFGPLSPFSVISSRDLLHEHSPTTP